LRPYRVVSYNTHFAAVIKAKKELADLAKGAIEGTVPFGNPVTDFAPNASSIGIKKAINDEESEEAGFLDHLVLLEENSSELVQILVDIGNQTDELNKYTENATEEIGRINASSNPNKAKRLQSLLHEMGDRQIEYANVISDLNDKYSELLKRYETSLEFIVTFQKPSTAAEKDQLRTLLVSLSGLENSSINARESFSRMAMALDELPKMERHLNRAKQHASREIKRFADNTDQTVAIASRVRGVGERILRDSSITLLASQS
jgi:vacuolar-type H+-ATPase subunit I/STV1